MSDGDELDEPAGVEAEASDIETAEDVEAGRDEFDGGEPETPEGDQAEAATEDGGKVPPAAPVATTPAKSVNPFDAEPYDLGLCTVTIQIVLLPIDGDKERQVMVGVRNHQDPWILETYSLPDLPLPPNIWRMLQILKAELPARQLAKEMRDAEAAKKPEAKPAPTPKAPEKVKPKEKPAPPKLVVPKPATSNKTPSADQIALFG